MMVKGLENLWNWIQGAAVFLAGIVAHAGAMLWRGGKKENQFEVFGRDLQEIKSKVEKIPRLESDIRQMKQALFDHNIIIRNGEH